MNRARHRGAVLARLAMASLALLAADAARAASGPSWEVVERPAPVLAAVTVDVEGALFGCLVLLEGEEKEPDRRLAAVCPVEHGTEIRALGAAREHALSLAAVPRAEGLRLWIGVPGGIVARDLTDAGALGPPVELVRDARLSPDAFEDLPDLDDDGRIDLVQPVFDGLAAWRQRKDGSLEPLGHAPVPPTAALSNGQMTVRGLTFRREMPDHGHRWSMPRTTPGDRLMLTMVPLGSEGPGAPCSAWIATDAPRRAVGFVATGGPAPRLVALTMRADRHNLLGEYDLIVAALSCDPTRRGSVQEATIETPFPVGFSLPRLALRDLNGDGREDVVVTGRAGRMRGKVGAAVLMQRGDGTFHKKAAVWTARSELPADMLVDWTRDLTGDRRPDLLYGDDEQLVVLPGRAEGGRALPLDRRGKLRLPWPGGVSPRALVGYMIREERGGRVALPVLSGVVPSEDEEQREDEPRLLLLPTWTAPLGR